MKMQKRSTLQANTSNPYLPTVLSQHRKNYKNIQNVRRKKRLCLYAKQTHIQQRILLCSNDNHTSTELRTATSINSSATSTFLYSFHSQIRGCCYKYEEKCKERLSPQLSSRQP